MFAFPTMLVPAAKKAGIPTPTDPETYDMRMFPHFAVFCLMQLGQAFPRPDVVWTNAEIIASIPNDHIHAVTPQEIYDNGFEVGHQIP